MATNTVRNSSAARGISIVIDEAQEQIESGQQPQRKQQQRQEAEINISPSTNTNTATKTPCKVSNSSSAAAADMHSVDVMLLAASNKCNNISNSTTFIDINCNEDDGQKWRTATAPLSQLLLRAAEPSIHVQDKSHNEEETSRVIQTATATTAPSPASERRKAKAGEKPKTDHKVDGSNGVGVGVSITHERSSNCNAEQLEPVADDEVVTTTTIIACNDSHAAAHHRVARVPNDDGDDDDDDDDGNEVVESRRFAGGSGYNMVSVVGVCAAAGVGVSGRLSTSSRRQPDQLADVVAAHSPQAPDFASALTESVAAPALTDSHVVKIKISPSSSEAETSQNLRQSNAQKTLYFKSEPNKSEKQVSVVQLKDSTASEDRPKIEHSTVHEKMVLKSANESPGATSNSGGTTVTELNVSNPSSYLYYMMSSGQFSPCDTLDSGTGSDLESSNNGIGSNGTAAPSNGGVVDDQLALHRKTTEIRVNGGGKKEHIAGVSEHQRGGSVADSEESESSLSCDSLNSSEYLGHPLSPAAVPKPPPSPSTTPPYKVLGAFLPDSLLRDIRDRKFPTNDFVSKYGDDSNVMLSVEHIDGDSSDRLQAYRRRSNGNSVAVEAEDAVMHADYVRERNATYAGNMKRASLPNKTFVLNAADGSFVDTKINSMPRKYEADKYYDFHVNEHENFRSFGGAVVDGCCDASSLLDYELRGRNEDAFAGYKDVRLSALSATIRSSKGTVRGVKNRVRNGIATFLQLQQPNVRNFKDKDVGKVVLYTTSMGIIRDTYAKCSNVKQILRTLLVKFEERDVFMSVEYQQEIKERMHSEAIKVPQLFVEGQHIGDAETVERLNESGELRQLLKPYKSIATTYTCQTCGGYRLLPCPSCNGSKKSVHRNHFTAEFVALKCMNCDEVGLVKCHNC